MKKVINGAVYDTATAAKLGEYDSGYPLTDFRHFTETLYRTKSGKYFLHGEGGGNSRYGIWHGNSGGSGEKIMPLSYEEAQAWAEEHLDGGEYIAIFGDPENGVSRVYITISAAARQRLERIRSETGKTLSEIVEGLIMAA